MFGLCVLILFLDSKSRTGPSKVTPGGVPGQSGKSRDKAGGLNLFFSCSVD